MFKNKKSSHLLLATFLAVSALSSAILTQTVHAATLAEVMVRFDRMKASQGTTGTVCAKPTTAGTEAKVAVTFPTGFTLGAFGTFTVNSTSTNMAWPTGGTAWLGITAPASGGDISGQTVTFASSDLVVGTLYCFNWTSTSAVTEPSGTGASELGTVTTQTSAPATIDSAQYSTATITDDQIVVTATVPTAFSFALSANTDALGTLGTGTVSVSPTPRTATVNTNAKNGWIVWAKDANAGLNSSSSSYTIPSNCSSGAGSNSTLGAGTEGYNTGVTQTQAGGSGTITVQTPFVGGVTGKGGGLCTTFQPLAESTGSADTAVLTVTNNAAIKGSTPAATDYTDTITVVGAGLF
ncbi:MAG TPA: hypothetical protein VLF59_03700 [Candidatus Saccharimonadales bacterium]|nr:hypothetical protein [Candidatus Saccharimonadales bacterium]